MKLITAVMLFAATLHAQDSNPLIASSKTINGISRKNILASVEKAPESLWSFRPTKDVRTFGQIIAHVADAQYEFCGLINEGKSVNKGIEKTAKTKAEVGAALKDAFAYCDTAYAKISDANSSEPVSLFGMNLTKLALMDFNTAHNMEHYGNLVTYMRINGIVPPSSEARTPAAIK